MTPSEIRAEAERRGLRYTFPALYTTGFAEGALWAQRETAARCAELLTEVHRAYADPSTDAHPDLNLMLLKVGREAIRREYGLETPSASEPYHQAPASLSPRAKAVAEYNAAHELRADANAESAWREWLCSDDRLDCTFKDEFMAGYRAARAAINQEDAK